MSDPADLLGGRVLIVDEPAQISLLEAMLGRSGYTSVASTTDPCEARELHRKNRYDLIILDFQMPGTDGLQLMQGLREVETEGYLPVLALAADPSCKLSALRAGARDFIPKPIDEVEMLARIHNLLEVRLLLRESKSQTRGMEGKYRALLEAAPDAMVVVNQNEAIVLLNVETAKQFGYHHDELLGQSVTKIIPQGFAERLIADAGRTAANALAQQIGTGIELVGRRKDGSEFPIEIMLSPLESGEGLLVTAAIRDITVRKSNARRLLDSEREYRLLFDDNPHPMWVFDVETLAFLAVNDAAVRLYGFSRAEFLGMTIKDIRAQEEVAALLEYVAKMPETKSLPAVLVKHRKKDHSLLEVEGVTSPIDFRGRRARLVMASDVTETKRLQAQLLQSQKMEAVGRLAGGVAHDFNNALGVILGYTELLMLEAGESQQAKLDQIQKASQRASGLTRQLLAFSRQQIVDPKVLDLNALLSDLEKMLGRLIGEDVELAIVPGASLGLVKADPGQLEQVVMNLCVNARDAMPDGGSLRIETSNADLDETYAARHEAWTPGPYVRLAVSDTGCGIEKETLSKIFEPFFTTKEVGQGTGLGLAMLYGVVKQANGYVWVYSEVGKGTTFKIYLPRVDEAASAPEQVEAPMLSRGSETILLVEDEAALRGLAREILEESGYRVIEAASGAEAIELAQLHLETIHLLVTDVVMPRMNGRVLAEALVVARPELRVLYMSGYTDDVIAHRGVLEPGTLLLEKPFGARGLLGRVREALGAHRNESR